MRSVERCGEERSGNQAEKRREARTHVCLPGRYGRLLPVVVVELSPGGLRVESERSLPFGPGSLWLFDTSPVLPRAVAELRLDVRVVWARLIGTVRGPFGEICPRFAQGLALSEGQSLRRLLGSASAAVGISRRGRRAPREDR